MIPGPQMVAEVMSLHELEAAGQAAWLKGVEAFHAKNLLAAKRWDRLSRRYGWLASQEWRAKGGSIDRPDIAG